MSQKVVQLVNRKADKILKDSIQITQIKSVNQYVS